MFPPLVLLLAAPLYAEEFSFPHISTRPAAADYSVFQSRLSSSSFAFDENDRDNREMDFRSCDLTSYDLAQNPQMLYASFNTRTRFPKRLPSGYDPAKILELGKDPGLGLRSLHARGITGKGVGVAIIDQSLLTEHVEYADRLRFYEQMPAGEEAGSASMHGPAVASLAVGKTVGAAPQADLYFIAAAPGRFKNGKFVYDLSLLARAIARIIEVDRQLPRARRIRVLSISLAMVPKWKNADMALRAIAEAEKAGILVLTVDGQRVPIDGMGRPPLADPNRTDSYAGALMYSRNRDGSPQGVLQVPMDSRTLADPNGPEEYYFARVGGQSWTVPWTAGLFALACQVRPGITPEEFRDAALATARSVGFERDGKARTLSAVVDPPTLFERLEAATKSLGPKKP